MAILLTVNGVPFQYPEVDDEDWGSQATLWAQAITQGTLQFAGGAFTLLSEVDFGGSYGIKAKYLKSRSSDISTAGLVRLARTDSIGYRNFLNNGDLLLEVDVNNRLTWDGQVLDIGAGDVTGPGGATDEAFARFDTTTGKLLQNGVVKATDAGAVTGITSLVMAGALSGVTSLSMAGALSGATTGGFSGALTAASLILSGAISGVTTLSMSGALSGASSVDATILKQGGAAITDLFIDVIGSSTDNALARWDGSTGKQIQNSPLNLSDAGDLTPDTSATQSLGIASKAFNALFLDHGGSDSGSIYFDAGTTSFLQGSSAGLTLRMGGFNTFRPDSSGGANLGSSSARWGELYLNNNVGPTTAPTANALYADLIPKAWAWSPLSGTTNRKNVNLPDSGYSHPSTGTYTYTYGTDMATDYNAIIATAHVALSGFFAKVSAATSHSFTIRTYSDAGVLTDCNHSVIVMGTQ